MERKRCNAFKSSYKDMSENHSGTLTTLGCVVSSCVGATVPFITGLIVGDDMMNSRRWRSVLIALASFYIVGNVAYTVLGSNQRQQWDRCHRTNLIHYNGIIDANEVQLEEFTDAQVIQEKKLKHDTAL